MYSIYYAKTGQLEELARKLSKDYRVFSPLPKDVGIGKQADYLYRRFSDDSALVFNPYRSVEPLKAFFTYNYEKAADYFTPLESHIEGNDQNKSRKDGTEDPSFLTGFTSTDDITDPGEKTVVFGVKNCDITGHKIQDFVFLEGVELDSLYRLRRENTILISGDCTDFKEVCHCLAWGIMPYPSGGFDLNLSPLNDGFIVEVGSKKGEELVNQYKDFFCPIKDTQIAGRNTKRQGLLDRLKRHLLFQNLVDKNEVQKLVRAGFALDTWEEFMRDCVECGGCNFICDTCHCFLLADSAKKARQNQKLRVWDSCQYKNYARVAGGANPQKTRAARLRFRFTKKFDFFVDNLGIPACCGCGRCIEVCPGKIDIREVLKDLAEKLKKSQ